MKVIHHKSTHSLAMKRSKVSVKSLANSPEIKKAPENQVSKGTNDKTKTKPPKLLLTHLGLVSINSKLYVSQSWGLIY